MFTDHSPGFIEGCFRGEGCDVGRHNFTGQESAFGKIQVRLGYGLTGFRGWNRFRCADVFSCLLKLVLWRRGTRTVFVPLEGGLTAVLPGNREHHCYGMSADAFSFISARTRCFDGAAPSPYFDRIALAPIYNRMGGFPFNDEVAYTSGLKVLFSTCIGMRCGTCMDDGIVDFWKFHEKPRRMVIDKGSFLREA